MPPSRAYSQRENLALAIAAARRQLGFGDTTAADMVLALAQRTFAELPREIANARMALAAWQPNLAQYELTRAARALGNELSPELQQRLARVFDAAARGTGALLGRRGPSGHSAKVHRNQAAVSLFDLPASGGIV